jgi:hypothetical protein
LKGKIGDLFVKSFPVVGGGKYSYFLRADTSMSRPLSIENPGAFYHIINRAVRGHASFLPENDFKCRLVLLEKYMVQIRYESLFLSPQRNSLPPGLSNTSEYLLAGNIGNSVRSQQPVARAPVRLDKYIEDI